MYSAAAAPPPPPPRPAVAATAAAVAAAAAAGRRPTPRQSSDQPHRAVHLPCLCVCARVRVRCAAGRGDEGRHASRERAMCGRGGDEPAGTKKWVSGAATATGGRSFVSITDGSLSAPSNGNRRDLQHLAASPCLIHFTKSKYPPELVRWYFALLCRRPRAERAGGMSWLSRSRERLINPARAGNSFF